MTFTVSCTHFPFFYSVVNHLFAHFLVFTAVDVVVVVIVVVVVVVI